jgi:hypothetical protein
MLVWTFLIALVLVAVVVIHSMRQGRRFVRAATFLTELEAGRPAQQANAAAALLFGPGSGPQADAWAMRAAEERRKLAGTTQAEIIRQARERGFEA